MELVPSPDTLVPPMGFCQVPLKFVRSMGPAHGRRGGQRHGKGQGWCQYRSECSSHDVSAGSGAPGAGMAPSAAPQRCQRGPAALANSGVAPSAAGGFEIASVGGCRARPCPRRARRLGPGAGRLRRTSSRPGGSAVSSSSVHSGRIRPLGPWPGTRSSRWPSSWATARPSSSRAFRPVRCATRCTTS